MAINQKSDSTEDRNITMELELGANPMCCIHGLPQPKPNIIKASFIMVQINLPTLHKGNISTSSNYANKLNAYG